MKTKIDSWGFISYHVFMDNKDFADTDEQASGGKSESFLDKLISFFLRGGDPEREKKRLLKDIGKQLKKQKYKFYKPKGEEALPGLARFFYEIYRVVGPAQILLDHAGESGVLKTIVIEGYLNEEQLKLKESLDEEKIRERANSTDLKVLTGELKDNLISFFAAFDIETVKNINKTYNMLQVFLQFVNFDYFFLLKKFDSTFPEHDFIYNPKFENINGEYVADDLKDFLEILPLLDKNAEWDRMIEVLNVYKGSEVMNSQSLKKLLRGLGDVNKSGVFVLMVRHITRDPYFKPQVFPPADKIVEEYLNKIKTQSELTIQKILRERKNRKVDQLKMEIFGTTAVSRTKYYTEKTNIVFSKKMLAGFLYIEPLNYLKAFLLDYYKRDIREVVDVLLIKGKWSTNMNSNLLSEAYHSTMEISDELIQFDESLADEGELGISLKNIVKRSDRDKSSLNLLRKELKNINDTAYKLISRSAQNLITIGKQLKLVIDDTNRKPHELIMNWRDLDVSSDHHLKEQITTSYKKIYYFIQLLQYFIKK